MSDAVAILRTISEAMLQRRLLHLNYHHYSRLVQPEALDVDECGDLILVGWQLSGGCETGQMRGRKEFRLREIAGASALDEEDRNGP